MGMFSWVQVAKNHLDERFHHLDGWQTKSIIIDAETVLFIDEDGRLLSKTEMKPEFTILKPDGPLEFYTDDDECNFIRMIATFDERGILDKIEPHPESHQPSLNDVKKVLKITKMAPSLEIIDCSPHRPAEDRQKHQWSIGTIVPREYDEKSVMELIDGLLEDGKLGESIRIQVIEVTQKEINDQPKFKGWE